MAALIPSRVRCLIHFVTPTQTLQFPHAHVHFINCNEHWKLPILAVPMSTQTLAQALEKQPALIL